MHSLEKMGMDFSILKETFFQMLEFKYDFDTLYGLYVFYTESMIPIIIIIF